jgi:hypothetical protein
VVRNSAFFAISTVRYGSVAVMRRLAPVGGGAAALVVGLESKEAYFGELLRLK